MEQAQGPIGGKTVLVPATVQRILIPCRPKPQTGRPELSSGRSVPATSHTKF